MSTALSDEFMYPSFGASRLSGCPSGIQYLHHSHEEPRANALVETAYESEDSAPLFSGMIRFCSTLLLEPIAIAVGLPGELKHMPLVREPIDKGQGHFVVAKNRGPLLESQVGCNDDRYSFIEITDQLKQELRPFLINRNEP